MMMLRFLCFVGLAAAFSTQNTGKASQHLATFATPNSENNIKNSAAATAAAIGLSVLLASEPAMANSKTAAQISLDSLPPTTVSVQIGDLPVIGSLLSGTYTRVDPSSVTGKASIVIKSPQDKIGAVKSLVTGGHIEFDVSGILATHLDVDVGATEAGVAKVRVASNLIPQLPFQNAATMESKPTGKKTSWDTVTNLGSGERYYYNEETGVSQREKPTL
jgi:hypothetical protein